MSAAPEEGGRGLLTLAAALGVLLAVLGAASAGAPSPSQPPVRQCDTVVNWCGEDPR